MSDKVTTVEYCHCNEPMAKLLTDLRHAQREFYASPQGSFQRTEWLRESKRLEKLLDHFLAERSSTQQKLF
jgi:hypothetical protein